MTKKKLTQKELSNPFSTGGGGSQFESHVQASFVALMATAGFVPGLPCHQITKIKLQGKYLGYDTDDLIVFVQNPDASQSWKLLGQIKHSISMTSGDKVFGEVLSSAWNDFNNTALFTKKRDIIALVTGPLTATDNSDVRVILEWARHSENSADFFTKVNLAQFSSEGKRRKLAAFRTQLKKANSGMDVSDELLFEFLQHFNIFGFDLDIKSGVTLALLQSLIGQYSQDNAQNLWRQIVEETQSANKNAGTVTIDSLPSDLKRAFTRTVFETIPQYLSVAPLPAGYTNWNGHQFAAELSVASLLGSWNENVEADKAIASELAGEPFASWISKLRQILQEQGTPVSLKNGVWAVSSRAELWRELAPRVFDTHLAKLKESAVTVLSERDPQFELPKDQRYAASVYNKVLKHSHVLRRGLSESLALVGNNPNGLINCSREKPEETAFMAVREILQDADWVLWGSLSGVMPIVAEAAPGAFFPAVESAMQATPCPFVQLFSEEGMGMFGGNYITGLLWALETLAWDETQLVTATVALGDLAALDPGGNWSNRPINSLTNIFLPWLPQTLAPFEKRKVAIQTLRKEQPAIAWDVVLSLLPKATQHSSGSHKPEWRQSIPEEHSREGVTHAEYWEQVEFYADLALAMAKDDGSRLIDFVKELDDLPVTSFEETLKFLEHLGTQEDAGVKRLDLWTSLMKLITRHRKFTDANWALRPDLVARIESVANLLAPKDPLELNRRLFNYDHELYEGTQDINHEQAKLADRRQAAIQEILDSSGLEGVLKLAKLVEVPRNVGFTFGTLHNPNADSNLIPALLTSEDKKTKEFIGAFIWASFHGHGRWEWVDKFDRTNWSKAELSQFLINLPFVEGSWTRAKKWLGTSEGLYWDSVVISRYQADTSLDQAIDKLLEYGRPFAAIDCLYSTLHEKEPLDVPRAARALLDAASSHGEPLHTADGYEITELIKALQNDPNTKPDDLFRIEWTYLELLDRYQGVSPKYLESRLASDPKFFCEVLTLLYRSKNEAKPKDRSGDKQAVATRVYRLLSEWQTIPGSNGAFDGSHFKSWLESVKTISTDTGHLEVALTHVGNVLLYAPADPKGLWINEDVADALNQKDVDKMRSGYAMGVMNARGAHWVDSTAKPELELAAEYKKKAVALEDAGFQRFAATVRNVAKDYEREARRIIDEHNRDKESD